MKKFLKSLAIASLAILLSVSAVKAAPSVLSIVQGGTGTGSLPTGLLKGNGTGSITAATPNTDYLTPTGNGSNLTGIPSAGASTTYTGANTFTNANQTNIANLGTTLQVDQYSGSDICAKINAADAASPAPGTILKVPAGAFTCSTLITFNTLNKRELLEGAPGGGTTITWTNTSGNAITINNGGYPVGGALQQFGYGLRDLKLVGPGGTNTTVGLYLGGSNGAQGALIQSVTFKNFHQGTVTGANTWAEEFLDDSWSTNDQAFYLSASSNSGENVSFLHSYFADCNTEANCVQLANSSVASADFVDTSFDDAQLRVMPGNEAVNLTGGHMENPATGNVAYPFIVIDDVYSNYTNVNASGVNFYMDATTNTPAEFILNGGNVKLTNDSFTRNTGATTASNIVQNDAGYGSSQLTGTSAINTPAVDYINSVGPATDSTAPYDSLSSKIGSYPFGINQNSNNIVNFTNGGLTGATFNQNQEWNFGSNATATGYLTAAAGTTTIPSLVIPTGTLNTTTVAGAIEHSGGHLYFTDTNGGTRYQLDQQSSVFPSGSSGTTFYNTTDQVTNYEKYTENFASNIFTLGTSKGGTGTIRNIQILTDLGNTNRGITIRNNLDVYGILNVPTAINGTTDATDVGINPTFTNSGGLASGLNFLPTINQSGTAGFSIIKATLTETAFGSGARNFLDFNTGASQVFRVEDTGHIVLAATNTPFGTNGAQTINNPSGIVNMAASGTSLVVTDSIVTTNSIVTAVARTNDSTCYVKNVVPVAGSFTINMGAACTAATSIGFIVTN